MKDSWRDKYNGSVEDIPDEGFSIFTAFNANIDRVIDFESLKWNLENTKPERIEKISSIDQVKKVLKFAIDEGTNLEIDCSDLEYQFDEGSLSVGGQAAITSNFLSQIGGEAIFYTPLISKEIADILNEDILHPYVDDKFEFKKVSEATNTDTYKENVIIEFQKESTGRLILSDRLRGFGPYMRSGIEENIGKIDERVDAAFLSGFHNAEGNFESKIEKSRKQITKMDSFKHLELVDCSKEKFSTILEKLSSSVDSIGMDENEALKTLKIIDGKDKDSLHLGEAFKLGKDIISETNIERVHIHTYRYHTMVSSEKYSLDPAEMRNSLLFGEISAIVSAEAGRIPEKEDYTKFKFDNTHVRRLDELEEFQNFMGMKNFAENGFATTEGYKVAAIPTLIHENPKRLVGLGDLISSGSLAYDVSKGL